MSPRARRISRALVLAAGMALVAGCGVLGAGQGDPSAPVLVRGRMVDASGLPVAGAKVQVMVLDEQNAQVGQRIPTVFDVSYGAAVDGTFEIHLAPPPALVAMSTKNGGYVNFQLLAVSPDGSLVVPWAFPRELKAGTWSDAVPEIELRPLGIQ